MAKELLCNEVKRRRAEKEKSEIEAYNNWRAEEIEKGRLQDEHSKSLIRSLKEAVKAGPSTPVDTAVSNVLGNMDGNYNNTSCFAHQLLLFI